MKKYLILAVTLVVIGGIIYLVTKQTETTSQDQPTALSSTYQNAEYGYQVSYPETLTAREYAGGNTAFGTPNGEGFDTVAEVRIVTISGSEGESLQEAAARELSNLCAADGPSQSFSCTGLDRILPFTADSGLKGYELYLKAELLDIPSGEKTAYRKGPYYVFPLAVSATMGRALVVHPALNIAAEEADVATIRSIARSVIVTEATPSSESVEAYVAANISTLSTMPEVLGGTFYVTAIEAADGRGTVSYEDGHNAYTADFTYSFRSDGTVSIDSFTVKE
ncbi:MAG TPA: hypothetical protein VNU25_03235 [Candidatus Paceibacterota bacterium]|nr:hypothetical protein [Candidatus Paceibacterota bacterium]